MQYLIATSRNHCQLHNENDNTFEPPIEIILTLMDRHREFVGSSLVNVEETSTVRIGVAPDQARDLAKRLIEWADQSESLSRRITPQPEA